MIDSPDVVAINHYDMTFCKYHSIRRFNVAITRGMALCVIVGQPFLLMSDPYWKQLLNYCHAHGNLDYDMLLSTPLIDGCRMTFSNYHI